MRLYSEIAEWWPLISPPEEYADEIPRLRAALGTPGRLLELGSGGGHVASHLSDFERSLVDLSPQKLEVSRALNPDCQHIVGDMRDIRLRERFDAVLVHDAIDYLLTRDDVAAMLETAAEHLVNGGHLVLAPDGVRDTFVDSTTCGGADAPDGRGARFCEWVWDPDPHDTTVRAEYSFMLRDADGHVDLVQDSHVCGLFSIAAWQEMLSDWDDVVVAVTDEAWGEGVLITARRRRR